MKKVIWFILILLPASAIIAQEAIEEKRVHSYVDSTIANELTLIQEFEVHSSIEKVWQAYTTVEGWESAFVPMASMDFRIGGTIKTNYNTSGHIGDSTTIVLHIINYVPHRLLTLQAELSPHFPEFMKEDSENLYNIIYFESIDESKTKITSYGIGYRNNEKYRGLLKFFISGNESSYLNFIKYLETGETLKH